MTSGNEGGRVFSERHAQKLKDTSSEPAALPSHTTLLVGPFSSMAFSPSWLLAFLPIKVNDNPASMGVPDLISPHMSTSLA